MPLLLIDGDILIYEAAAGAEQELEFQEDQFILYSNLADACNKFVDKLDTLTEGCPNFVLCLSDPNKNWRKDVYPQYKGNRKSRKPLGWSKSRSWVEDKYECVTKPSLEADDVIGILATKPNADTIVWSPDKDLKQIPGKHLTDKGITIIGEVEGDYFHLRQTLTGDQVDGYPGCPGIGPVKADKALSDSNFVMNDKGNINFYRWHCVRMAYEKAGLTEDDALVQARIARICRWSDWDSDKQKVRLWTP